MWWGGGKRGNQSGIGMKVSLSVVDSLVTKNLVPVESVYEEERVSVSEGDDKIEYRAWNSFYSKLAAVILGGSGIHQIHIKLRAKVLYLGTASGTTVSHIFDIFGPHGLVYAVEFSHYSGQDLSNLAKNETNITAVVEDAWHKHKYCMLIPMVDVIFATRPNLDCAPECPHLPVE
ncbi:rRNA 2' [Sigmodon hispidus]